MLEGMEFQQFYLGCLAQASYLIGSDGQAAVVDPRRDVDEYLDAARARGLEITFVVETHLHADFVSGYRELAERTGATVVFSRKAEATFPHWGVGEGDEIRVGHVILRVLETPGHTPESLSLLVIDSAEGPEPKMVLTGDTLFIGDVGRPDLSGARGHSPESMAGLLYDSLHEKLLRLPDAVEVYPGHGAGSLCGRHISKETSSTIGEQRRTNYALRAMPRADFVKMMTVDLPEVPAYFPADVQKNREGAPALGGRPSLPALGPHEVRDLADGASLVDVRTPAAFGTGHVPGSVNIGLGGQFASWAGTLLPASRPIVIVAEDREQVDEAALRLSRVGLEGLAGYLDGGIAAWDRAGLPLDTVPQVTVDELEALMREDPALQVVDVRRAPEYAAGHVPRALHRPLDRLERELDGLDPARPTAVLCAGGYRSSAAAGLLRRHGFCDLRNVVGGTSAWTAAGYATEG
jgi:hydroxyacylglutathione hydrolase